MFTYITLAESKTRHVIVLPSTAISYSLYGNSVFVIEKNRVKRVFVATGEQQDNFTVINSGIKAGQFVVSSGELKLQNGAKVIINNKILLNKISSPDKLGQ